MGADAAVAEGLEESDAKAVEVMGACKDGPQAQLDGNAPTVPLLDPDVCKMLQHPVRQGILIRTGERPWCPSELARDMDKTVKQICEQVDVLLAAERPMLELVETRSGGRGGPAAHFYRAGIRVTVGSQPSGSPAQGLSPESTGPPSAGSLGLAPRDVPLSVLRIHKMLGHRVRYRMMLILCERPASATDLVREINEFGWASKQYSEQITLLKEAEMVELISKERGPKGGIRRLYRANPRRVRLEEDRLVVLRNKGL